MLSGRKWGLDGVAWCPCHVQLFTTLKGWPVSKHGARAMGVMGTEEQWVMDPHSDLIVTTGTCWTEG